MVVSLNALDVALHSPTDVAWTLGQAYLSELPTDLRKARGQFFTPPAVAKFMASLLQPEGPEPVLIDPGCGSAILACAAVEALVNSVSRLHVHGVEKDPALASIARRALSFAAEWAHANGAEVTYRVDSVDYLASSPLFSQSGGVGERRYDLAISNPPYFKLPAQVGRYPNIYAEFLIRIADALSNCGQMVVITPRSFATGSYFRRFRGDFFNRVAPSHVHLFDSRREAFSRDGVLQENIILRAVTRGRGAAGRVMISQSYGASDISAAAARLLEESLLIDLASQDRLLRLPVSELDQDVVDLVKSQPADLASLGLSVSTGPVVAFRARSQFSDEPGEGNAPLLWLHNVNYMQVTWPLPRAGKHMFVQRTARSQKLLTEAATSVLVRRFSAKEDYRRITSAPLFEGQLPGSLLGIENHLNYIHRPGGSLEECEAVGVAAILGSHLMNQYFRTLNGHTQVNASELRSLPLPGRDVVREIGSALLSRPVDEVSLEPLLMDIMRVPRSLAAAVWQARVG